MGRAQDSAGKLDVSTPDERPRSERLAVLYLQLATACRGRGPVATRDRLLLLAARHASDANWVGEAETCRELVLLANPRHIIGRFDSFAAAQKSDDFQALARQLQRQCPQEMAEHLAERQQIDLDLAVREPPRLVAHELLAGFADETRGENV